VKGSKVIFLIVVLLFMMLFLTACGQPNPLKNTPDASGHIYGFWKGIWDGLTSGWAFIFNLFGGHYGLYEVHNNGGWYDFGYYLGLGFLIMGGYNAGKNSYEYMKRYG